MSQSIKNKIHYSVIVPVYNEEECLPLILERINKALQRSKHLYEIICIDDCSSDKSWQIINGFHKDNPQIKGIQFSRNFGHQFALFAGIKNCQGNYVAILDADGQDPPELLPKLFEKCEQGFDVVYAVRKKRKENIFKRIAYNLFYRLYKLLVPFEVPLDSGDFAVFSRDVIDFIKSRGEKNPFIRGLRSWYGGKQCSFEYTRDSRLSGQSKYSTFKLMLLALNGFISFSKVPLRLISIIGIIISILSCIGVFGLILMKYTVGIPLLGWTSTALLIIFFGGLNLFVLGIIGEYIGDIFDEVKNRPSFMVKKYLGFTDK